MHQDCHGYILLVIQICRAFLICVTVGNYVLFTIITSTMATILQQMGSDLTFIIGQYLTVPGNILKRKVVEVQRRYRWVCLAVDQLHHSFEWTSMAHVTYSFISILNYVLLIFRRNQNFRSIYVLWSLDIVIRFISINWFPTNIKKNVRSWSFHSVDSIHLMVIIFNFRPWIWSNPL